MMLSINFLHYFIERDTLRDYLTEVYDIERLVGRVSFGNVNAKDLVQLKHSIAQIPAIKALLQSIEHEAIAHFNALEPLDDLLQVLSDSLVDEPPLSVKEGGLFKSRI